MINQLTLVKSRPRKSEFVGTRFLSAAWSLREIPGLVIQRRRAMVAEGAKTDDGTAWVVVSELLLDWIYLNRDMERVREDGDGNGSYYATLSIQRDEILQRLNESGEDGLADRLAFALHGQRFGTRQEALRAVDVQLVRMGIELV